MTPLLELEYTEGSVKFSPPLLDSSDAPEDGKRDRLFIEGDNPSWVSGMASVTKTVSDVVVGRMTEIGDVSALMMGRSGDVHHVWVLLKTWTSEVRKTVYEAQVDLVKRLRGFDLDFYVVPAEHGERPTDLVSDIHVIYPL